MKQIWQLMLMLIALLFIANALPVMAAEPAPLPWDWTLGTYRVYQPITVGDQSLVVEIADTPALQTRGLSYRDGLADGTGMLFTYDSSSQHSFWMKGMRFCLDIIWINDGIITGAAENACDEPGVSDAELMRYPSTGPAQFVLEVPGGWVAEHGLGVGTPVDLGSYS